MDQPFILRLFQFYEDRASGGSPVGLEVSAGVLRSRHTLM
jgi:hypothetical protein